MAEPEKIHPSKINYWIHLPILGFLFYYFIKSIVDMQRLGLVILTVVFGLILLPMLFNTYYAIKDTTLNVHSGIIINTNIDIANIK